jgi:hypothetical protein
MKRELRELLFSLRGLARASSRLTGKPLWRSVWLDLLRRAPARLFLILFTLRTWVGAVALAQGQEALPVEMLHNIVTTNSNATDKLAALREMVARFPRHELTILDCCQILIDNNPADDNFQDTAVAALVISKSGAKPVVSAFTNVLVRVATAPPRTISVRAKDRAITVLQAIGSIGLDAHFASPVLVSALANDKADPELRRESAQALVNIGSSRTLETAFVRLSRQLLAQFQSPPVFPSAGQEDLVATNLITAYCSIGKALLQARQSIRPRLWPRPDFTLYEFCRRTSDASVNSRLVIQTDWQGRLDGLTRGTRTLCEGNPLAPIWFLTARLSPENPILPLSPAPAAGLAIVLYPFWKSSRRIPLYDEHGRRIP